MIFAVRTTLGREQMVAEKIAKAVEKTKAKVYSITVPKEVKGYVFIEAESIDDVNLVIRGLKNARGIVKQPIDLDEIKQFVESKKAEIKLKKGDIVEIVSEPFKGEKAKVIRIDAVKREVTVEMIEAAIPIPMTLPVEAVRLLKSGGD